MENKDGDVYAVGNIMTDISDSKALEARLERLAYFDSLTGLANRTNLKNQIKENIKSCQRNQTSLAILLLDLDNFKNVNDTLGHSAGDEVLKETARRLCKVVRETDTVARLGGDEFVIVLNTIKNTDCVSNISQKIIDTFKTNHSLQQNKIQMQTSIGIAVYPNDGDNFEILLKNADLAMYSAKSSGKNDFHFFSADLQQKAQSNLELKQELETAIEKRQFEVFYQPKLSLIEGEIIGAEALVRWNHPKKGIILPKDFIEFCESSQLIIPIGREVLKQACAQIKKWSNMFNLPIYISVNLSTVQFKSESLVNDI